MEIQSRRALELLNRDVRMAKDIAAAPSVTNPTQLTFTMPDSSTVVYAYNSAGGTLTRTAAGSSFNLLSNIAPNSFNFYCLNKNGAQAANSVSIKQIEVKFTAVLGVAATGTKASYSSASSRLILRNKYI